MEICEWCGEKFDKQVAEEDFEIEMGVFSYANIRKCLCGSCAIESMKDEVDGIYFERCEECGVEFDYIEASSEFDGNFSWANGTRLTDYWNRKILCCDCALKEVEKVNLDF